MQKDSAQAKISLKVVGVYFFDSPCITHLSEQHCVRVVNVNTVLPFDPRPSLFKEP